MAQRYFLGKDPGAVVREKHVFAGDSTQADGLVAQFLSQHPGWTAPEVDQPTFDAAVVVVDPTPQRADALTLLATGAAGEAKLMRAILLVILDEINLLRTNAALNLAPRTIAQMKTAIQTKINAGTAD